MGDFNTRMVKKLAIAGITLQKVKERTDGMLEASLFKHQVEWLRTYADISACIPLMSVPDAPDALNNIACEIVFRFKHPEDMLPDPFPHESVEELPNIEVSQTRVPMGVMFYSNGYKFTMPKHTFTAYSFTRNPSDSPDYVPHFPLEGGGLGRGPLPARHGAKWYVTFFPDDLPPRTGDKLPAWGPFETEDAAVAYCRQLIADTES